MVPLPPADDDEATEVQTLLNIECPKGYCGPRAPAHLARRGDPKQQRVTRFSCQRWECRLCGPRRKLAVGLHVGGKLLHATGSLFRRHYAPDEWEAGRQWLNYHGCSWLRIGPEDAGCDVVGVIPVPEDKKVLIYSDADGLIRRLGKLLTRMPLGCPDRRGSFRPVRPSHDWSFPKGTQSAYERVRWMRGVKSPEQMIRYLATLGIEASKRRDTDAVVWDVIFSAPTGFNLADHDAAIRAYR